MGNEKSKQKALLKQSGGKKVNYKTLKRQLDASRKKLVNNVENQLFSLTDEVTEFSERRGGDSKMDLCVLANKPTRNIKMLAKDCQDEAVIVKLLDDVYGLAVFDGHGEMGERVSQICNALLQEKAKADEFREKVLGNPEKELPLLIKELHQIVGNTREVKPKSSGTTATIALLDNNKLHVSWVGDSKAVLLTTPHRKFLQMRAFELTDDHNFTMKGEVERVKSKGGFVAAGDAKGPEEYDPEVAGPLRLWESSKMLQPGLAMSRSIGDLVAHSFGASSDAGFVSLDLEDLPEEFRSGQTARAMSKFKRLNSKPKKRNSKASELSMRHMQKLQKSLPGSRHFQNQSSDSVGRAERKNKQMEKALGEFALDTDDEEEKEEDQKSSETGSVDAMSSESEVYDEVAHSVLVVASDGVWTVMTKEEVAMFLSLHLFKRWKQMNGVVDEREKQEIETNLSTLLCLEAQKRWLEKLGNAMATTDDISAITVVLK